MTRPKTASKPFCYQLEKTALGQITVIWAATPELKVKRILLPAQRGVLETDYTEATLSKNEAFESLLEDLSQFLEGEDRRFNLQILDLGSCAPFQRRVLHAEYNIPRGRVSTYGRIAKYLGNASGARAVGRALATNPFPLVIPCHRAVKSNGELGGYQGGEEAKRWLLKMEGVRFTASGKVLINKLYY
jgi:methylated-DNA-[protein]-cysteine S-methyltransferase